MNYWRMQLHPAKPAKAAFYAAQSLSAGFIGLDFHTEVGDLNRAKKGRIPKNQKDYVAFCGEMEIGDKVLIIVHHFPFAVATIAGDYNYILNPEPELGVWFRHFRRVKNVEYFSDFHKNVKSWEKYTMTDTIAKLKDPDSKSFKLIKDMGNPI